MGRPKNKPKQKEPKFLHGDNLWEIECRECLTTVYRKIYVDKSKILCKECIAAEARFREGKKYLNLKRLRNALKKKSDNVS